MMTRERKVNEGTPRTSPLQCYDGTGLFDEGEVASASAFFRRCAMARYFTVLTGMVIALCCGTLQGVVYEDSLVSVDEGTVVRHLTDKGIVYVFTATNETTVTLRQAATLDAALVVGGGGSGGTPWGGGGGGGGVVYRESFTDSSFATGSTISLQVGAGGAYVDGVASNGVASVLSVNGETITAYGGGHGGCQNGNPGAGEGQLGSGGGSGIYNKHTEYTNGVHYTTGQGFPGGLYYNAYAGTGGGGGAGEAGRANTASVNPGKGGEGVTNDITGVAEVYGSGGGAHPVNNTGRSDAGRGGTNAGDGAAVWNAKTAATASSDGSISALSGGGFGRPGFGGGGGGSSSNDKYHGGGGSGTVILRFAYPSGGGKLIVSHNQNNDGSCTPEAGEYVLDSGERRTLTAATGRVSGGWRWSQIGYAISESIDGGTSWSVPETNYAHRVDFVQKGNVWTHVTWLWRCEEVVQENGIWFAKNAGVTVTSLGKGHLVTCSYASGKVVDVVFSRYKRVKRMLVVGGGGAGGRSSFGSGGGDGGGVLEREGLDLEMKPGDAVLVCVGKGGAVPSQSNRNGANGGSSTLWDGVSLTEAYGGGGGAGSAGSEPNSGEKIASGGGLPCNGCRPIFAQCKLGFNHVHYTWGQGWPAAPRTVDYGSGGGGGGAGGWGTVAGNQTYAGNGGEGVTNDITGVAQVYGSGGGGSTQSDRPATYDATKASQNGLGGTNAGDGQDNHPGGRNATAGVDGFGGGGGAAAGGQNSGKGGSGVVIFYCEPSPRGMKISIR